MITERTITAPGGEDWTAAIELEHEPEERQTWNQPAAGGWSAYVVELARDIGAGATERELRDDWIARFGTVGREAVESAEWDAAQAAGRAAA